MKNKPYIYFILFVFFFKSQISYAENIDFDVTKLEIYENGNLIKGLDGGKAIINTNSEITAEYFEYNKITTLLKAFGNAVLVDKNNNIIIKAEKIFYLKSEQKIYTEGQTFFDIEKKYEGESSDVVYYRNIMIASSDKKTFIKDKLNNSYYLDSFIYDIFKETLKGENAKIIDKKEGDTYNLSKTIIDLKTSKILGQDISIDFRKDKFDNIINDPRLKGVTGFSDGNKTIVNKGLFTVCKKRGDKCPPWVVKADRIRHDKEKKTLYYKNALLKIYDMPVWYYPFFFHPDPSVKRQSGFLKAASSNSKLTGQSIYLPYFHVISESKDLTFRPYIFTNNKILLQNEYRQLTENTKTTVDFSFSKGHHSYWREAQIDPLIDSSTTKTHFFLNTEIDLGLENFERSNLNINLQKVSNDTYLSLFKLKSTLFKEPSSLTTGISLALDYDKGSFDFNITQNEKLAGLNQDRYSRQLPSYNLSRIIDINDNFGTLNFTSGGYNTLSNTNIVESRVINNLNYKSNNFFSPRGFLSVYKASFKNVNSSGKNSDKYTSNLSMEGMSSFLQETSFPLIKTNEITNKILTPKIAFRYSPKDSRDISTSEKKIGIGNIFEINRIGEDDTVEPGGSMIIGLNYQKINNQIDKKEFEFEIANSIRAQKENKLPVQSTINKTTSDLVGRAFFSPNDIFNISYNFSLDNDLNTLNYNHFDTTVKYNKLTSKIRYSEQSELFGSKSYYDADFKYDVDKAQFLSFKTRRNRQLNLTEFYNLVYNYQNDCLIASIDFKKSFYEDRDIKPTEELFFQITIVPMTQYETTNLIEKTDKLDKINKLFKPGEW